MVQDLLTRLHPEIGPVLITTLDALAKDHVACFHLEENPQGVNWADRYAEQMIAAGSRTLAEQQLLEDFYRMKIVTYSGMLPGSVSPKTYRDLIEYLK